MTAARPAGAPQGPGARVQTGAKGVRQFPWGALDRLTRKEARASREARERLAPQLDPQAAAAAACSLLGVPVEIQVRAVAHAPQPPPPEGLRVGLSLEPGAPFVFALDLEQALAVRLCTAALGKPAGWVDPRASLPPELAGAASAVVVAVARRCGHASPWKLSSSQPHGPCAVATAVVLIGDDVFEARAVVPLPALPAPSPRFDRAALGSLGDLPLSLPLVVATCAMGRGDLAALTAGSALLPGEGWRLSLEREGRASGEGALVAPGSEQGLEVELRQGLGLAPSLVLTPRASRLPWEPAMTDDPSPDLPSPDPAQALEDVPVVLRVEVATVTLAASEWARLRPGDVVATGVRLGEPVTLRAGGVAFARGELCDLEGELAVRILERKGHEP